MSSFKFKVPLSIFVCESNGAFARFSFCTGDCSSLVFCPEVLKEIHLVNSTCCTVHADCISSGILQMRRGHFDAAMCFQRKLGWNVYFDFNSCSFKGQNLSVCVYVCVSVRTACNLIILDSYTSYLWLVDFQRGVVKLLLFDVLCCKSVRALVACSFCLKLLIDHCISVIYIHTQYVY